MSSTTEQTSAALSDGTMPCPVPSPDSGNPCIKSIPQGWAADEGHPGGHWWESPAATAAHARGVHYDAALFLSGQPTPFHEPADCTPACLRCMEGTR
jgi:hypothetical protein